MSNNAIERRNTVPVVLHNHPYRRRSDFHMSETLRRELDLPIPEREAIIIEPVSTEVGVELFEQWRIEEAQDRAILQRRIEFRERIQTQMPLFNPAPLEDLLTPKDELPLFTKNGVVSREQVRTVRRLTSYWDALRPAQRVRVAHALALIYLDGFSDGTARELKAALYHQAILRAGMWNGLCLLLARYSVREILLQWRQYSQVGDLDRIKIEIESKG